jgi:hypothetical protein
MVQEAGDVYFWDDLHFHSVWISALAIACAFVVCTAYARPLLLSPSATPASFIALWHRLQTFWQLRAASIVQIFGCFLLGAPCHSSEGSYRQPPTTSSSRHVLSSSLALMQHPPNLAFYKCPPFPFHQVCCRTSALFCPASPLAGPFPSFTSHPSLNVTACDRKEGVKWVHAHVHVQPLRLALQAMGFCHR